MMSLVDMVPELSTVLLWDTEPVENICDILSENPFRTHVLSCDRGAARLKVSEQSFIVLKKTQNVSFRWICWEQTGYLRHHKKSSVTVHPIWENKALAVGVAFKTA